ncbi:MAG: LPXTG cell wall anchor domain-containing protein [Pirellulales bacterium]
MSTTSLAIFGIGALCFGGAAARRRRKEKQAAAA